MAEQQRLLGGRYLLKEKVGTGGMATVFRAQDQVLNRAVAVKIMLPQYAGDPTFAARFKLEAQAAAALQSPYHRRRLRLGQGWRHLLHRDGAASRHRS